MTAGHRTRNRKKLGPSRSGDSPPQAMPLTEERFAILGHEIRNPLSALTSALQAWPTSREDSQLTDNLLQIMRRQVTQLTRLCNDLLDTESSDRGHLSIYQASVDAGQIVRNACEQMQPLVGQCGHKLTVALASSPLTLFGDESRLTQVFANLLHNSAKFTDRHGQLQISLERDRDAAVVRLSDNGRGICPDRLPTLFSPDRCGQRRCKSAGEGLGIGLRLAKSIVELHGGTIEARSEGLGLGSMFVVRLPLATEILTDSPIPPSRPTAPQETPDTRLPPYRILVVDDDRSSRYLLSRLLRKLGQSVTVADHGDDAMPLVGQSQPHAVFLDLQMPGRSGYEVARQIRCCNELDPVVLIALSGHADAASRKLAAESGFDQYLVKPASMAELADSLGCVGSLWEHAATSLQI